VVLGEKEALVVEGVAVEATKRADFFYPLWALPKPSRLGLAGLRPLEMEAVVEILLLAHS